MYIVKAIICKLFGHKWGYNGFKIAAGVDKNCKPVCSRVCIRCGLIEETGERLC